MKTTTIADAKNHLSLLIHQLENDELEAGREAHASFSTLNGTLIGIPEPPRGITLRFKALEKTTK